MHSVRSHASDFLRDLGIVEPPLRAEDCLDLRRLQIAKESLDEFLRGAGRDVPLVQGKLDAMLDLQERSIWLRKGLHAHKAKLGKVHEVGHDVLPWQSAVLHYCSILDLPIAIQREWELEATAFALDSVTIAPGVGSIEPLVALAPTLETVAVGPHIEPTRFERT